MVKIRGVIDKITIGQKKEGDQLVPVLTLTVVVPVRRDETVGEVYSVFQEQATISFEEIQESLEELR